MAGSATAFGCGSRSIPLRTTPPGAYVFVDGNVVARTPTTIAIGRPVHIYLPGFKPFTVTAEPQSDRGIDLVLESASPPETAKPPTSERKQAWTLTRTALDAARRDDCAVVKVLDRQVSELDREFHRVVFVRELALASCLTITPDAP